jgi:hypothetical protein
MMMKLINRIAMTIGATAIGGSALAHHSGHFFVDEMVTLTGTVKEMQLTNPHSWIEMMVPNDEGELVQWSIEMSAPIVLFRRGWTRETIKPGDEVTVVARPMRDGRPGAIYVNITLPDGSTLGRVDLSD